MAQRKPRRQTPDHRVSAAKRGYDYQWRKARKSHIDRNPLCAFCGGIATEVDHIVPLQQGGPRLSGDNLRSVCRNCHAKLTANYRRTGHNDMPKVAGAAVREGDTPHNL